MALLIVAISGYASVAQETGSLRSEGARSVRNASSLPDYSKDGAMHPWERFQIMYRAHRSAANRAVRSMCVECLGAKYNQVGAKPPLLLGEELSNYKGEPQLEREP